MKSLSVRELIHTGLFSILLIALTWLIGMVGLFPVMMPVMPFLIGLVTAPVFMLYATRIHKFGMMTITGIIFGIVFGISGHGIYVVPGCIILALIAEYILKAGDYKSTNNARWAYTVFAAFSGFNFLPIFIARDAYMEGMLKAGYDQAFVDQINYYMPSWGLPLMTLLGCVGAYLGCTVGIKLLDKHFKKAGMV